MVSSTTHIGGKTIAHAHLFAGQSARLDAMAHALQDARGLFVTSQAKRAGDLIDEIGQLLAYRVRDSFDDGVYQINLQGDAPLSHTPVAASQAQRYILSQLIAPAEIPHNSRALNRLYRDTFAKRNALLVLTNAADIQQIRYLIPRKGAKVILTSVRDLSSSFPKLHPFFVSGLDPDAAYELLTAVSPRALLQNKRAVLKLCELLEYSPLSIAIVAPLLEDTPRRSSREIANRYQEAKQRIHALHGEHPAALDCALEMAYDTLQPTDQIRFAQLAVFPGKFTLDAVRVIWNVNQADAKHTLRVLTQRNLVNELPNSEFVVYQEIQNYIQKRLLGRATTAQTATQRYIQYIFQQTLPEAQAYLDIEQPLGPFSVDLINAHLTHTWLRSNNQVPGWVQVDIDPYIRLSTFMRLADALQAVLTQQTFAQWLDTAITLASTIDSPHTLAQLQQLKQA